MNQFAFKLVPNVKN